MRIGRRIRQGGLIAVALFAAAGCSNTAFVYKPGSAAQGVAAHPAKVAVLPFRDGTEDFVHRGGLTAFTVNLARGGSPGLIKALPPEFWAKSFAEELTASGAFRSVRFVYSPSELLDEDFYIEGTVLKAYFGTVDEYDLAFRAFRRADQRPVWEKQVARSWKDPPGFGKDCSEIPFVGDQCWIDSYHADLNRLMREMFSEAGKDFVATLGEKPATAPATEPADAAIDTILKGK